MYLMPVWGTVPSESFRSGNLVIPRDPIELIAVMIG